MTTHSRLQKKIRESRGGRLKGELEISLENIGVNPEMLRWLSLEETDNIVEHWKTDYGMESLGRLFFPPPEDSVVRIRADIDESPFVLQSGAGSRRVSILFQDFEAMGIAEASLGFVAQNISQLAKAEQNGFVTIVDDVAGVLVIDLEGNEPPSLSISWWGEFLFLLAEHTL